MGDQHAHSETISIHELTEGVGSLPTARWGGYLTAGDAMISTIAGNGSVGDGGRPGSLASSQPASALAQGLARREAT